MNIKKSTLAALNAVWPEGRWEERNLTEEDAIAILQQYETARAWKEDGDEEAYEEEMTELLQDVQQRHPIEDGPKGGKSKGRKTKMEDAGEGDGEGENEDGDGDDGEAEGAAEEEPDLSPRETPLDDYIVHVVRKRRDEVLEGIEWGGKNGRTLTVKRYDAPDVEFDHAHEELATLVTVLAQREPVLCVGPAGSGKTTAFLQAAEALGVPVRVNSNSRWDNYSKAFGYVHPGTATYQEGYMYGPMKDGMLLADDEVDASNENVMVSKNTAIENRFAWFPNGEEIVASENFFYAGSANTYGRGADRVYVGRTQLDGATIDRFVVIDWEYDEDLERMIAPNERWTDFVQQVREIVFKHKMRYIVSPRASIKGGKLLAAGLPERKVRNMVLFKGWPQEDLDKVMRDL